MRSPMYKGEGTRGFCGKLQSPGSGCRHATIQLADHSRESGMTQSFLYNKQNIFARFGVYQTRRM